GGSHARVNFVMTTNKGLGRVGVGIAIARDHRVAGGSRPPPAPTERSVRICRATLFRSCFTVWRSMPEYSGNAIVRIVTTEHFIEMIHLILERQVPHPPHLVLQSRECRAS